MSRNPHRRQYSQNFLADRAAIERMIRVARPSGLVLEPGGGSGALTRPLTERATVWTWEIDPHFAEVLRRTTDARVFEGDFARARVPNRSFQVVGNIPYSATARIVDWCLAAPGLRNATIMVQLEVALKRSGGYGRWSRLTALTWPWFRWGFHGRVPASAFRPVPRVDSGILRIERRATPLLPEPLRRVHERVVQVAYTGVGGSVGASIGAAFGTAGRGALVRAGVAPGELVARVHPDAWIAVAERLATGR